MKLFVLILSIILVNCILKERDAILTQISSSKISQQGHHSLGSIISSIIQMQKDITETSVNQLFNIDQFIDESFKEQNQEIQKYQRFQDQNLYCNQYINATIEQIQNAINIAKTKINTLIHPKIEELSANIYQRQQQIEISLEMCNTESEIRSEEQQKLHNDINNFYDAKKICQQCIDSFFENSQNNIPISLNQIEVTKRKLIKLNATISLEEDEFWKTIKAILEMLENNKEGQINKILKQLGDLQDFIREKIKIVQENEQKLEKMWEQRKTELKKDRTNKEEENNNDQQELNFLQEELNEKLKEFKQTHANQQQIYVNEEKIHQDLDQQLEEELKQMYEIKQQLIIDSKNETQEFINN